MADGIASRVIGVVLAGGQSSRMGRDKALLPFGAQTLLAHQVARLGEVCAEVWVSGVYADFNCIADHQQNHGPLAGLHAAAARFPDKALLVLPVDMPALQVAQLAALIHPAQPRHYQAQPLPAFFPQANRLLACIEQIANAAESDFSIQHVHRLMHSQCLPVADVQAFANLNYAADWQAFVDRHHP